MSNYEFINGGFQKTYSTEEICEIIKNKCESQNNLINNLRKENSKLLSEHYKDERLSNMSNELEKMRKDYFRGFPISEDEDKKINQWIDKHEKVHKGGHGCSGGKYQYIFTPTSIGTIGEVVCSCGKKFCFQELS